jgi:hypothetical protein
MVVKGKMMALDYSDKRNRYKSLTPADFSPGIGRFDNPSKPKADLVRVIPAHRGTPPREGFRVVTAPPKPEPPPVVEVIKPEPIPFEPDKQLDTPTNVPGLDKGSEL